MELAERAVVARHRPFTLQHVDFDARLAVGRGRERLALARRNRGVALDQRGHHAAERLDAERERRDVEEQEILHLAAEHAGLNRRADRHDFVRVDALVRFLAEQLLDDRLHARHARRAADQHHFVNLRRREARVGQRLLGRTDGRCSRSSTSCSNLARVSLQREVLRTGGIGRDERQIDLGLAAPSTAPSWPSPPLP